MSMKRLAVVAILALAMSYPVAADDRRSEHSFEPSSQHLHPSYSPSLAVVMELTQLSHFKLWLAGHLGNWALADYELGQMVATLEDAKRLFPNVPKADTSALMQPARNVRAAIKAKDGAKFDRTFEKFTAACNDCHRAAGLEFIAIKVPLVSPIMTSPLSDQAFAPK